MRLRPNTEQGYLLIRSLDNKSCVSLNGFRLLDDQAYESEDGDILAFGQTTPHKFKVRLSDECIKIEEESPKEVTGKRSCKEMEIDDEINEEPPRTKLFKLEPAEQTTFERLENGHLYLMTWQGVRPSEKIAAYDIDGTIIKTKSGRVFAKDIDDWQIAYPEIPGKLKDLYRSGFKIVFITNQSGMTVGKLKPEDFKKKLTGIIGKLNLPIQVFIAPAVNKFRKPMTGMWEYLEKKANGGVPVDRDRSFYVGDAAGRPARGSIKKDHSCCDRLMALNLNLAFFTPEEHFQKAKVVANWIRPEFQADQLDPNATVLNPSSAKLKSPHQEIILMVGYPGSGKSYFTRTNYGKDGDYVVVNRDRLGNWQKCVAEGEKALAQKKSLVVDNTNPDLESRKRYIELGQKFKVPVRCFLMAASFKHAKHNIRFREILDPNHMKITDMILNSYK